MSKQVNFKRISVEGFGSFCNPVNFKLDRNCITMIKGDNGNGKTTLFSALAWCMFKVNLKGLNSEKIPTWERNRTDSFRGTRVIVEFSVDGFDYLVARHLNFSGTTKSYKGKSTLMIFKKPEEQPEFNPSDMLGEEQYKKDQQGYINRTLGLDDKTFLNSVLFGQKMKRLIEADNDDKRKLFETLFELEFIGQAKKACDLKLSEKRTELEKKTAEKEKHQAEKVLVQQSITDGERVLNDFKEKQKLAMDEIRDYLQQADKELKEIEEELVSVMTDKSKLEAIKFDEIKQKYSEAKAALEAKRSQLTLLELKIEKELNDKVQARINEVTEDQNKASEEMNGLLELINADTQKIAEQRASLVLLIQTEKEKFLKDKVEGLDKLKSEEKYFRDERDSVESLLKKKVTSQREYQNTIAQSDKKIEELNNDLETIDKTCPYCSQDLPESKLKDAKGKISESIKKEIEAREVLKKQLTKIDSEVDDNEVTFINLLDSLKDTIEAREKAQKIVEDASAAFDEDVVNTIYDSKKSIEALKYEIAQNQVKISTFKDKIAGSKEKIAGFQSELLLKTKFSDNEEWDRLEKEVIEMDGIVTKLQQKAELVDAGKEKLKEVTDKAIKLQGDKQSIETAISLKEKEAKKVEAEKKPDIDLTKYQSKLFVLETSITTSEEAMESLAKEIERFNWWSKEGFSSAGLKAFVFNSGLTLLNKACEKYASRLGVRMEFSVDLTKASKPFLTKCYKNGFEIDYNELSGGQKARLDVATAFALHDVISSTSSVNILILDEVFESLDQNGVETVFDLIRTKAGDDKSVYVVTHNPNIDAMNTKTIEIGLDEKENSYIY